MRKGQVKKYMKKLKGQCKEGKAENGRKKLHNEIETILNYAPKVEKLLDIGFGNGDFSVYFKRKGSDVVAAGINIDQYELRYNTNYERLKRLGIKIVESNVENLQFDDNTFDGVLASHILEHTGNMKTALLEIRRVLKREGWLFCFIPRFSEFVIDDHVNTGYNLGQLIYILAINGFDVKNGKFIEYGYSLCAFVQKSNQMPELVTLYPLQELRDKRLLPSKIIHDLKYPNKLDLALGYKKDIAIGYDGNFKYLNFPNARKLLKDYEKAAKSNINKRRIKWKLKERM